MGATYNENFPSYIYASSMADRRVSKQVHDNVHGNIYLDPLSLKFIDTEQFQRLRDLKQLGLTYLVYPGAVHSRFEHSLGVYWLASETIHRINYDQGSELGIDRHDIQTVKLAGLLHDVGHGPFSHLFEKDFLPRVIHGNKWSHEEMSIKMIDYIVDEHNIEIDSDVLKKVKEMIVSSYENNSLNSLREKRFLYDIVANGRNGIDVDKFDYIVRDSRACGLISNFRFDRPLDTMRVIGDEICYRAKEYLTIHKLFSSRADLHRTVYTHAKVKAIDLMLADALTKANNHLDISSCINDPAEYWKLDDSIMKYIETAKSEELKESRDLILRIRRRDLYMFCNEFTVPKDQLEHFKDVTPQDIICSQMTNESVRDMTSKFAKLDKFEGHDFRRWQKKMHFLLTTLKVVYVLSTPMPEMMEDETVEQTRRRSKWENDDYICRGHILNGMSDSLFDVYQNVESAKELWDSLESKYMAEDASSKKFLVSNFINYKMVDSRPVMEQYNELLRILGQFVQHNMKMDESISVSSVIDKLPPSWKDFKHTLKHNKEEMTLVELGSHFRIEEALRAQEIENNPKGKNQVGNSSVNMVEDGVSSKNSNKDKGNKRKSKGNNNNSYNKKPKLACWKCGKPGHFKKDCRVGKGKQNAGPSGSKDPEKQQG